MKENVVGWFEIYVEDILRAKKFYETVFDKKLIKMDVGEDESIEMWSFESDYEKPGSPGALVKMEGMSPGKNSVIIYFNCEDCAIESGRVAEAGGAIQTKKTSLGEYGFMAMITDTEGNTIGLFSMK